MFLVDLIFIRYIKAFVILETVDRMKFVVTMVIVSVLRLLITSLNDDEINFDFPINSELRFNSSNITSIMFL